MALKTGQLLTIGGVVSLGIVGLLALSDPKISADDSESLNREAVEKIIEEYIMANPETILKSLEEMQKRLEAEAHESQLNALTENYAKMIDDPSLPSAGNPNGDITLVEFFDYHCGYCKKMVPVITQLIEDDPNVRVVFMEFPILAPDSQTASLAALAVNKIDKDKYFAFHANLMGHRGKYDEETIKTLATSAGLDADAVITAMKDEDVVAALTASRELGQEIGVRGTPAMIIGGQLIPGAMDVDRLKERVNEARGLLNDAKKELEKPAAE